MNYGKIFRQKTEAALMLVWNEETGNAISVIDELLSFPFLNGRERDLVRAKEQCEIGTLGGAEKCLMNVLDDVSVRT